MLFRPWRLMKVIIRTRRRQVRRIRSRARQWECFFSAHWGTAVGVSTFVLV
jgi:hypothetical protein